VYADTRDVAGEQRQHCRAARPWLDHLRKVFLADDVAHIVKWCAQRVQRPQEKINHALVLGGAMGIGKDAAIEPVKRAVGPWNCQEISPSRVTQRFNGFLKSVILRINEAHDLGDLSRYDFYDAMKAYTAAPPDVLRVDEKNLREHHILNCTGIIYTTNHKQTGMFLPPDDRRHYVAWSDRVKEDFEPDYWKKLFGWYDSGGDRHVAAYLAQLDISAFDPKAPPPKTTAFWEIVDSNRAPEESELADVLDKVGNPDAVTLQDIVRNTPSDTSFHFWLEDRRNRRTLPHRLEQCGYVAVRNGAAKDGLFKIKGARQTVYGKAELSVSDRLAAVTKLTQLPEDKPRIVAFPAAKTTGKTKGDIRF
jgi:Family of unknown function (DUF5906)